jgi:anti-sigma-K factor RskA
MNCEELKELFELYSLGLLEGEERKEVEAHLERNCSTCRQSLKNAISLNTLLIGSVPDVKPPRGLRHRILVTVGVHRTRWAWVGVLAAASLLVITLWLGNEERQRGTDLAEARKNILEIAAQRDQLEQAMRILDQPETIQVTFGKGLPQPPRGNVFVHSKLGVVLIASNLPRLTSGRTYEMWLIPKGGAPRPAGLFQSTEARSALHILSGPVDVSSLGAVAVTVEPAAGSSAPTTQPLIVAAAGA